MCLACTTNNRKIDFPWLAGEVEKYIADNPQVCTTEGPGNWLAPEPFSTTWYMIENYILLRDGYIQSDCNINWAKVYGKTQSLAESESLVKK